MRLLCCVPDLTPLAGADNTGTAVEVDEDGDVLATLSGRLLADESGDQPLCLFFGGPAFAGGPA